MEAIIFKPMGCAMGTKRAMSFANIHKAEIETNLIQQSNTKPREWKCYIDDVFSVGTVTGKMLKFLLKKLTISILQLSSRPCHPLLDDQ